MVEKKNPDANATHILGAVLFIGSTITMISAILCYNVTGLGEYSRGTDALRLQALLGWVTPRPVGMVLIGKSNQYGKEIFATGLMKEAVCTKAENYIRLENSSQGFAMQLTAPLCYATENKIKDHVMSSEDDNSMLATLGSQVSGCAMIFDCGSWKICNMHAMNRCMKYKTFYYAGSMGGLMCMIVGACGSLAAMMYAECEPSKNKKLSKQKQAKITTFAVSCGATCCSCIGGILFFTIAFLMMDMTDAIMPEVGVGTLMVPFAAGVVLMLFGNFMAGLRVMKVKRRYH